MAKAGFAKSVNSNKARKEELQSNFIVGSEIVNKYNHKIIITGYWGDRNVICNDGNIYNVEYDFGYTFKYSQLIA
jgi:hypothetical protein